MKKLLSMMLALVMIMACIPVLELKAYAEESLSETEENLLWNAVEYTYTCGTEDTTDDIVGAEVTAYLGTQTDVYVPGSVKINGEDVPVLKLADNIFEGNDALNSVTLNEGILEIGDSAFKNATNLVCIMTPESLKSIGNEAFSGCTAFNSIILRDSVTQIGENAFFGCENLVIYCNENSVAHDYAVRNGIDYVILGSVTTPEIYTENETTYYLIDGVARIYTGDKTQTDLVIPSSVKGYPVTEILASAYAGSTSLISVTMPDTVTVIGDSAFANCKALVTVNLSKNLKKIGNSAFYQCSNLKTIELPENLKELGNSSFSKTTALKNITLPQGLVKLGSYAFNESGLTGTMVLPDLLEEIPEGAFYSCKKLQSVISGKNVKKVGDSAFNLCGATTIVLNDEITTIEANAFYQSRVKNLTLPKNLKSVGENGFLYASYVENVYIDKEMALWDIDYNEYESHPLSQSSANVYWKDGTPIKKIVIPEGVTTVKPYAYTRINAEELVLPNSLKTIGTSAFSGFKIEAITLNEGLEQIGNSAFSGCTLLKELTISNSVKTIGTSAFYSCVNLETVKLPESITKIPKQAFYKCTSIKNMIIPKSVSSIDTLALDSTAVFSAYENTYGHYYLSNNGYKYMLVSGNEVPDTIEQNGLTYYIYNNEARILKADSTLTDVVIPDYVNGYPVTSLQNAFKGNTVLKSIKLSSNIKEISDQAFYQCSSLETIDLGSSITRIGASAFYKSALTEISLPESITSLGASCFLNCKFTKVEIPSGVTAIPEKAFYGCTLLEEVVLPDCLKTIGGTAFNDCYALETINVPDSVESIGERAFEDCDSLKEFRFPKNVKKVQQSVLSECDNLERVVIPEGVTHIEAFAFTSSPKLKTILIPKSVYSIYASGNVIDNDNLVIVYNGSYGQKWAEEKNLPHVVIEEGQEAEVFEKNGVTYAVSNEKAYVIACDKELTDVVVESEINGCPVTDINKVFKGHKMQTITLPETVTEIDDYAFSDCSNLTTVNYSKKLTKIGEYAFQRCTSLEKIYIPKSLKEMGMAVFKDCVSIDVVEIEDLVAWSKVTWISSSNNPICFAEKLIINGEEITDLVITKEMSNVTSDLFNNADFLTSVTFEEGVKNIGARAFYGCDNLEEINFPESIVSIEATAFGNNIKLTEIKLSGEAEKTIGQSAFSYCTALESVEITGGAVSLGSYVFDNNTSLKKVVLPDGTKEIPEYAFHECKNLTDINLPDSIEKISKYAFYLCSSLENIKLPAMTKVIDENAFGYCSELKNVILPANLETIELGAFAGTLKMTMVTVPQSVTKIADDAFSPVTIMIVVEDSYPHTFAVENDKLHFIVGQALNPEISYGTDLTGTAFYTDGSPASGATVEILYDDGTLKEDNTIDENGEYSFTYAEVGRYTIRVTDGEGNTASESVSIKRMNVFDVFLAGTCDLVLKKGYTVSGAAPDGAKITLLDINGNVIKTTMAEGGNYVLEKISNGTYIIKAETETGSASKEITVFDSDLTVEPFEISQESAVITGYVEVEDRKHDLRKKHWLEVTAYNSDGIAAVKTRTDKEGRYTLYNLPLGEYSIVAETEEMRPDKKHGYDRSHKLTGYAYVNATEAITYEIETIVLREENDHAATIEGKVTAQGETQDCEVVLKNVFRREVSKMTTGKNGKYTFKNVHDGLYFITAVTNSDGMGFCVVVVRDGKVYGETDIFVYKHDKISEHEEKMNGIPHCNGRDDAIAYKDKIKEEKKFYDSLSEKEKKQFSKEYVERLAKLSEWIADCEYAENGGYIENGGLIISEDEIESEEKIEFVLNVEKKEKHEKNKNGVKNKDDYIQHSIEDAAGDMELTQYYDITLTKNGQDITDIKKQTETTGKIRVVIDIPKEYRGHKHYSFVHVHNGEVVTLVDLDNNPNTVTFEIDKFSTFALVYTDEELTEENSASITYDETSGKISVSSETAAKLYVAEYEGTRLSKVAIYDLAEGTQGV